MTKNLWIPGAIRKPLPNPGGHDPIIVPIGDVFHVAVSEADSLFNNFDGRTDGIESTGYIRRDGTIEQYRPLNVECDAQGDGNSFAYKGMRGGFNSWETQGGEFGEWSVAQIASIKKIMDFKHEKHAVPYRICPDWNQPGFGYHCLFREWNHNGHTCPGRDRVKQFNRVFPAYFRGKNQEGKMNEVEAFKQGVLKLAKEHPIPKNREAAARDQAEIVKIAKREPTK